MHHQAQLAQADRGALSPVCAAPGEQLPKSRWEMGPKGRDTAREHWGAQEIWSLARL